MPRLFISHSSRDNIEALAFQRWLMANGWGEDEVFIDLHGIAAGEDWQKVLVKANIACDALLFLASPDSLASEECRREVRRAEDDGKDVIVAMLRGIAVTDERLRPYADRQIVDLSGEPKAERVDVEHQSRRHFIDFNRAALDAIHTTLIERGHAPDSFPWPPKDRPAARPYPGLEAMGEDSAAIFFGREADVMTGLRELRRMRERGSPRLMVIQAASGAGKSSFLRAGLWPKLSRTAEFVPLAITRPAKGIITGPRHGLGKGFETWFARHRHTRSAGSIHAELMTGDVAAGASKLAALLAGAAALASEMRNLGASATPAPSRRVALIIAVDQGEELFAAEDKAESDRFLAMLGMLLAAPPAGLDPYVLLTIRADSSDALLRRVPELGIDAPFMLPLPPLSPSAYRDVISRPAAVHSRRIARLDVEPELVQGLVNETKGADALPLLAFTLQRLFDAHAADRKLTLAQFDAMGGIGGSIDKALAEARAKAGAAGTVEQLRRLMLPGLATWDPAANAAKRLVPREAEIVGGDRADLAPLANALVEARLLTRSAADHGKGPATLEVAHEALLRRKPISEWLEAQKDALKLRDDVVRESKEWVDAGNPGHDLPRRGVHLESALTLAANADFAAAFAPAKGYLAACKRLETTGQRRVRRMRRASYALTAAVLAASLYANFKTEIDHAKWRFTQERPYQDKVREQVLATGADTKQPGGSFRECAACPEMVVVPAGTFDMGSPDSEAGHQSDEVLHKVSIAKPFAVGKFEVTWDEWEACVDMKGCDGAPTSPGNFGKKRKPVINVTWHQATSYVAWLARMTGQPYRLLTEAEWEYAARAGSQKAYAFGDDPAEICKHANVADASFKRKGYTSEAVSCDDNAAETADVGGYSKNAFGLHDMHGNVWEWVQDCHGDYKDAPTDGNSAPEKEGCNRVVRGGSWFDRPGLVRSAYRNRFTSDIRGSSLGFRVARPLVLPRTL